VGLLLSCALYAAPPITEGQGGRRDLTAAAPLSVLVSLHRLKCVFACSLRGDGCHRRRHRDRHIPRRVAPPVRRSSRVQAAPLTPSDFGHHFCEARLIRGSPRRHLIVCRCVGSVVFLPTLQVKTTQLRGSSCPPSSRSLAGAGTLAPGSIRCPELIAAVRFLIAIVVVNLSRCFCFAKTFCSLVRYGFLRIGYWAADKGLAEARSVKSRCGSAIGYLLYPYTPAQTRIYSLLRLILRSVSKRRRYFVLNSLTLLHPSHLQVWINCAKYTFYSQSD